MQRFVRDGEMKELYLGIDGGGTRTRIFVFDPHTLRASSAEVESGNAAHDSEELIRQRLERGVTEALKCWSKHDEEAPEFEDIRSAFFGMAGYSNEAGRMRILDVCRLPRLKHAEVDVGMEMRVTLFGGLEGRPGISLIVGTGTACYAENRDGRHWQASGWESLVSDEGGAYNLGLRGMIAAVRMSDGRCEETGLKSLVYRFLEIEGVEDMIHRLHVPPITKGEVAGLAVPLLQAAEQGDPAAEEIARQGASELGLMVDACYRKLCPWNEPEDRVSVSVAGGTMKSEYYREHVYAAIRKKVPVAEVGPPALPPVVGAVLLAMKQVGREITPETAGFLKKYCTEHAI